MLSNIRIVLINTTHPGNIGATARAMKTMGLSQLYLVAPKYFPHEEATALASRADDILASATVVESLDEALAGCGLVIGTSARQRSVTWPQLSARACGEYACQEAQQHPVALLFGQERTGLTNEQLECCDYHVTIPTDPDFSSLNLAQAVQVLCYELRVAAEQGVVTKPVDPEADPIATADELASFYQHLHRVLDDIGFLVQDHPKKLLLRIRRLFTRARLEQREVNILRGILSAVERSTKD